MPIPLTRTGAEVFKDFVGGNGVGFRTTGPYQPNKVHVRLLMSEYEAAIIATQYGIFFRYTFATATGDADPGNGILRLNNAAQNTSTILRIDNQDVDGVSWASIFDSWALINNTIKGTLRLAKYADPSAFITFNVTAVAAPSGYRNITIVPIASSGTNPFAASDVITVSFVARGDSGSNGIDGATTLTIVAVVATGAESPTTDFQVGDTIGGYALQLNDLVVRASATNPELNGVYSAVASGAASRHASFDTYNEHPGVHFSVLQGAQAGTIWYVASLPGGTLNTTPITIVKKTLGSVDEIVPDGYSAARDGATNDIAAFGGADAAAITAKSTPKTAQGKYYAAGDVAHAADSREFMPGRRSYLKGYNNISFSPKHQIPYAILNPTLTHVTVHDGNTPDRYNHVPSIAQKFRAVAATHDRIWIAWNGHPSSNLESTDGKLCYLKYSDDNGVTWSAIRAAWTDVTYCTNPITPGAVYNQPNLVGVATELWCFSNNNKTDAGWTTDGLIWSRLSTVTGLWTNYRFREDTTTGAISWSDTDLDGAPDAGFRLTHPVNGIQFTPTAQEAKILHNGRVCLLVTGIQGVYAAGIHRNMVFTCKQDGTDWRFEGVMPLGEYWPAGSWELSLTEDLAGLYTVIARRTVLGAAPAVTAEERAQYYTSEDLRSWSEPRNVDQDFAPVRPTVEKLSAQRWGSLSPIGTTRERLSLGLSGDGRTYTFGQPISNEAQNLGFPAYSMLLRGPNCIYCVYSMGFTTGPSDPRDIRFTRVDFEMDEASVYVMKSERGAVQFNSASYVPTISGASLTLPLGRSAGAVETRFKRWSTTLRWNVTANPASGTSYPIASIGNTKVAAELELRYLASGRYAIQVNGRTIQEVATGVNPIDTQIVCDVEEGWVEIGGRYVAVPGDIRFYLGDAYSRTTVDLAGDLVIDTTFMVLQELDRRTRTIEVVHEQTGPNLAPNSQFFWNESAAQHLMPDRWYRDIQGATLTTGQELLASDLAHQQYGGVMHVLKWATTVVGTNFGRVWTQWDNVYFLQGKLITVAFDFVDLSGLTYDIFLEWVNSYGTGGSAETVTAIMHCQSTPYVKRHYFTFRAPMVGTGVTLGSGLTLPTTMLRWRVPSLTALCNFRLGRVDIYEGAYQRDFMPTDVIRDYPDCAREYRRIRVSDAAGPLISGGITTATTNGRFIMQHTGMRKAPTLSTAGTMEILTPAGVFAVSALAIANGGPDASNINCTVAGATTNQLAHLRSVTTAAAELRLSAR